MMAQYLKKIFSRERLRQCIPFISVFIVSLLLAFLLAAFKDANLRNMLGSLKNKGQERILRNTDMNPVNYEVNNNNYHSLNGDPQLVINGVNDFVRTIDLYFGEKLGQDVPVEVFWGTEGESFSPERMVTVLADEGEKRLEIMLGQDVTDLRLDIGTSADVFFELDSVSLNERASAVNIFSGVLQAVKKSIWFDRFQLFFLIILFVLIHFVVDIKNMYRILFDKRWLVAGILLLFLVVNCYHGDSITQFDAYVQTGEGNDYIQPVLGQTRSIRSDEWMVSTPIGLSTQFLEHPYGQYNNILRGTDTVNGWHFTLMSYLNPLSLASRLIRTFFGYACAHSFGWYAPIFLCFLFNLELFYIISSGKKLISACGACMVVLSSHYLWWAFPVQILYAPAALVCAYYFFHCESWKKKIIFGYGTALGTTLFVISLYPAWQVPLGYLSLVIFVWIVHESWHRIKKMSKADWGIFASALLLCIMMLISYLLSQREYTEAITETVYPGSRIDYGGFSFYKIFNYIGAVLFPYKAYANPSEGGIFLSFFPLPLIMGVYVWIKSKKKDWLITGILIVSVFLGIYTTVGLPPVVAKLTLMTNSTSTRCVDMLSYAQIVLFVAAFSRYDSGMIWKKKYSIAVALLSSAAVVYIANRYMPDYMSMAYMIVSAIILFFIFFSCLTNVKKGGYYIGLVGIILVSLVNGIYVRPIVKGTDAIYSKPLAGKIREISSGQKGSKWIAYNSIVLPSFAVACGAPTINSVNTYPNMDLWKKLDKNGQYDYVYNRYAHVYLTFAEGETSMELMQEDCMHLQLSYQDIKKTDAKYIVSANALNVDNEYVSFEELYQEHGGYIYKINYRK